MRKIKEELGFTLIEMLIVLLIISVLILIAIPNVSKHSKSIDDKGCDAYVSMVQGQVEAYKMENKKYPVDFDELESGGYLKENSESSACPDGSGLTIVDGEVTKG